MLSKFTTTLALAASLGVTSLLAAPTPAEARPHFMLGMEHHHHHHGGIFFGGPQIFLGPHIIYETPVYSPGPCYWLRVRAGRTGSRYWFNRWHQCRWQYYGVY